jgi:hypothetical protein
MTRAASGSKKLEGEGSYSATRRYNEKLKSHVREQDVSKLAEDARRALEGPERTSLRKAEKSARKGPRTAAATKR